MISELLPYAQVGGTCTAAVGLLVNAYQVWRSRKAVTLQNLQDFMKAMNERELALAVAADDWSKQRHAFVEFLNFLEIYSAAANSNLFIGAAKEIVREKIVDSLVELEISQHWHDEIDGSMTSVTTYKHLRLFMRRNQRAINDQRQVAANSRLAAPST